MKKVRYTWYIFYFFPEKRKIYIGCWSIAKLQMKIRTNEKIHW